MRTKTLFTYQMNLFEKITLETTLFDAWKQVKRNGGAPGVDGVSIESFERNLSKELAQLSREVQNWSYRPSPVKRVEIPKPDGKGVRLLGIPCVRDRVLQASIKIVLEPLFEPIFSESSYGFRPGRSQEMAVKAAQEIVQQGKEYVVDIDLAKFFDTINHDRLIARIRQRVPDSKILRLIGNILRSGIMKDGQTTASYEGSIQGSPLSPLLSNIVLDELDKELEKRKLEFCRFADDCNIFVKTQIAAERVMSSISLFIERKLKLVVNKEKSKVALSKAVKFLGMTIVAGTLAISIRSMQRAMDKVKELTPRGTHLPIEVTMKEINTWYVGWSNYYKMTQYPSQFAKIEAHVRRRLRSRIIGQKKRKRYLLTDLVKKGVSTKLAGNTLYGGHKGRWRLSHTRAMEKAYPNNWFLGVLGQKIRSNGEMNHWFGVGKWIKLT